MSSISIIIPVLNEAKTIAHLLQYLLDNASQKHPLEIIVVDGGSTDTTKLEISEFKHVTLLTSEKGRAKQMNAGAKIASGTILYFLHADSLPPKHFDNYIVNEVNNANQAGCFIMKFDSTHWWLQLAGFLTKLPWKGCRGGDQSLFITKQLFFNIGGYDETFVIYEDNDFISKLYARNQFKVIQKWLTTSARRYKTMGVWRLQYHFWVIHLKRFFGASADTLFAYYKNHINVKN